MCIYLLLHVTVLLVQSFSQPMFVVLFFLCVCVELSISSRSFLRSFLGHHSFVMSEFALLSLFPIPRFRRPFAPGQSRAHVLLVVSTCFNCVFNISRYVKIQRQCSWCRLILTKRGGGISKGMSYNNLQCQKSSCDMLTIADRYSDNEEVSKFIKAKSLNQPLKLWQLVFILFVSSFFHVFFLCSNCVYCIAWGLWLFNGNTFQCAQQGGAPIASQVHESLSPQAFRQVLQSPKPGIARPQLGEPCVPGLVDLHWEKTPTTWSTEHRPKLMDHLRSS